MSPRLQRLRAEIASDARIFQSRVDELAKLPDLAAPIGHHSRKRRLHYTTPTAPSSPLWHVSPGLLTTVFPKDPNGFSRYCYAIDLDGARLEELRLHATALLPLVSEDMARFDKFPAAAGAA